MEIGKQWLLFDRTDIHTGTTEYFFDEARMDPAKDSQAQELHNFWNFCMTVGKRHGMRSLRVPFGIRFEPEKAHITGPVIPLDEAWETGILGYGSAAWDEDEQLFKLWYSMHAPEDGMTDADGKPADIDMITCYATSRDLKTWEKPALGIYFHRGVSTNAINIATNEGSIFLDPLHPETGKYKAINDCGTKDPDVRPDERMTLRFFGSDDGFRFRELPSAKLHTFFDTQNICFYDTLLGKYTAYLRGHYNGRAIARAEGDDFTKITEFTDLFFSDNEDPMDSDYYNNACSPYPYDPTYRIMVPSLYYHLSDRTDARMAFSRNGRNFQWVSRDTVIGNTDEDGKDFATVYAMPAMLPLGDKVGLLLRTTGWMHNEAYFNHLYKEYDISDQAIRMATWEKDRLAGIRADVVGEFWLQMHLKPGMRLQANVRTEGQGCLRCSLEVQRCSTPDAGYSMEDSDPLRGDCSWVDVTWNGSTQLPLSPDGQDHFLHVRLEKGKVFGFRILTEEAEANHTEKERIVSAHL